MTAKYRIYDTTTGRILRSMTGTLTDVQANVAVGEGYAPAAGIGFIPENVRINPQTDLEEVVSAQSIFAPATAIIGVGIVGITGVAAGTRLVVTPPSADAGALLFEFADIIVGVPVLEAGTHTLRFTHDEYAPTELIVEAVAA